LDSESRVVVILDMSDPICASLGTKKHDSKLLNSLDTLLVLAAGNLALERVATTSGRPEEARGDSDTVADSDSEGGGVEERKDPEPELTSGSGSTSESEGDRAAIILRGLQAGWAEFAKEIAGRATWTASVAIHQLGTRRASASELTPMSGTPTLVYGFDGYGGDEAPRVAAQDRISKAAAKLAEGLESLRANEFKEGEWLRLPRHV
jgi:hypothetical protein